MRWQCLAFSLLLTVTGAGTWADDADLNDTVERSFGDCDGAGKRGRVDTVTPLPTATATPTSPVTGTPHKVITCPGDCNGDHHVRIDELVRGVSIALGRTALNECDRLDTSHDDKVAIDELVAATNSATRGCLPDLLAISAQNLGCPGGCAPARVEICIANRGQGDAGTFDVFLNGIDVAQLASLATDAETCLTTVYRRGDATGNATIDVDATDAVEEENEGNNDLAFPEPNPTGCDRICGEARDSES